MFNFEVNYTSAKKIEEALRGLDEAFEGATQRAILRKVGNAYLADTLKRFENQHNPDRKPWKKLSPHTIRHKKHGTIKGRGASVDYPERRGVWTGDLINSLAYRIEGNSVIIGTDVEHARWFHYGVKNLKEFGKKASGGPLTVPWGPIPARRFLGRNNRIDDKVLKVVNEEITKIIGINPSSVKSAV